MSQKKRLSIALAALCMAVAAAVLTVPTSLAFPPCPEEICVCEDRQTPTVTRVGATCTRAQDNAKAAAMALANCNGSETPCGPVTYWVSSCSTNHLGQTQASAFVTYGCEVCFTPDC